MAVLFLSDCDKAPADCEEVVHDLGRKGLEQGGQGAKSRGLISFLHKCKEEQIGLGSLAKILAKILANSKLLFNLYLYT